MGSKIKMREVSDDEYVADDGHRMRREHGETPNGNPMGGRWVLRSPSGDILGFDKYRHDLAARAGLDLTAN